MRIARPTGHIAALALLSGLLVSVTGTAPAHAADAVAGAQTAGDSLFPNQGNGGYDVSHYDIDFRVDVGISTTSGGASTTNLPHATTTIDAVTTGAPLSSYSFDFQGTSTTLEASTLNIDSVTVNGTPAAFTRIENTTIPDTATDKHKLIVTPTTPVDGAFTTVVAYSGQPVVHRDTDNSIEGWNQTVDGATFVNQPVGSMTLFPNNNTPRDKATYTWTVDAPTTLTTSNLAQAGGKAYQAGVVSNGELLSRTPSADSTRTTWVWDQQEQQASELSFFSIGRYDIYTSDITLASGRTIPEWTFIDPALSVANQTATLGARAQLKSLLDFYETKYGPYPGNSTGVVTDNTTGIDYALETQDRPFFPVSTGTTSRNTFYHEVMHQWWGDNVSPTDWNDITLNEGPAQYSEFQFPYEGAGSSTTTTEQANFALYNAGAANSATFAVAPAAMTDPGDLFGEQVYQKGSITLEALRTSIGAADFETLMRQYQLTYGGGQITGRRTAAFQALAESISGRDLTAFFQAWWYTSGKPAWPVKFNLNVTRPNVQVNAGDQFTYTVTARNTGKVAMPAGTVVTVDLADVLDNATIGALPSTTTLDGTTLTWTVPATALAATANIRFIITANAMSAGATIGPVVRATTLGSTCLECAPSFTVGTAPIDPAPVPTISGGTPTVGTPLTAVPGTWADGTTLAYQWSIDDTPVPGATSAAYTPTLDAVGFAVTVKVSGTLAGSNPVTQTSAATVAGVRGTQPVATPTISGTPKIGQKLTVDPGTWLPGTVFTYAWSANGTTIANATGPVYTPAAASQATQTLRAVVTGTKAGYTTVSRTSGATTAVVAGDPLVNTPTPTLPATASVGTLITAVPGSWDDGVALTYAWQRDGTNIGGGGTAVTYTPAAVDLGKALTLTVTGTKPGITAVARVSAPVTPTAGTQVRQPTPTLTAEPHAGVSVNGAPGTWDTGTTLTYRWLVDGVFQTGATAIAYSPTVDQIGQALTFEVTSTRAGYNPVTATSAPSPIGLQVQSSTPTPTVAGSGQVATDLTATPGTWDTDTTQTYQWSVDGTPVDGATDLSYTVRAADLGQPVTITVTSTKPTYDAVTRTSAPVTATEGDLTLTPTPTINGSPKVDVALTAVPGTWDAGTTLTYQWRSDGVAVPGATAVSFSPTADDLGEAITVAVTGTRTGYTSITRASDPTAAVAVGDQSGATPTITGTPKVGVPLTADHGDWGGGVSFGYQWSVDGTPVTDATGASYTPTAAQAGLTATVAVTGTKTGYADLTRTSTPSQAIALGDLAVVFPTITGTPQVGVPLTAVPGDWENGVTLAYQWLIGSDPIADATDASYTPTAAQIGALLTVRVTATKPGYQAVDPSRDAATVVAPGDQSSTPAPTITGTPKVDVALTAVPGTWDTGTVLTYQWSADGSPVVGATSATYAPGPGLVGSVMTVAVTGTRTGYTAVTKTSAATTAVTKGELTATPVPTITGTPKVAVALAAVPGTWDTGTVLTYQWLADGTPVDGATASTYSPGPGELGSAITVAVTGTRTGYTAVTKTSPATTAVTKGELTATPVPTITGTPKVAVALTAVPGTWDTGTDLTYQWLTDGTPVDGATGTTYTPGPGQLGAVVTVKVTGTKTAYDAVTRTSPATAAVVAGDLAVTPVPTITGSPKVDVTLTAHPGTWDTGTTLTYQWLADGTPVGGASGSTYSPGPGQLGAVIAVQVTGTKAGYETATRTSPATAAVVAGGQVATPVPTITGTPKVAVALTAVPGTWDTGTVLTYQWLADGTPVDGATGTTYTPAAGQLGSAVTVTVTGTRTGYDTVARTSAATAAVAKGDQTSTPVPTITGTPQVDLTLTAVPGTWDTGTTLTYQWLTDGAAVDGATASTYTPGPGKLGTVVTVRVTGTRTGYETVTRTSAATGTVVTGGLTATPVPTITGTPKVDLTLTALPGTWDAGTTLAYQWSAAGNQVAGATGTTYTPGPALVGSAITVAVTGTKTGYTTITRTSEPTAAVTNGDPVLTPVPTITGTVQVGLTVTAVPGTWDAGTTLGYQWLRDGVAIPAATADSYTIQPDDNGARLSVVVTGTKAGYTVVSRTAEGSTVAVGQQVKTPKPRITGAAKAGRSLKATGSYDPGVSLAYAWLVDGKVVKGATKKTFKLTKKYVGDKVTVRVTATKTGYATVVATSAKSKAVKA